MLAAEFFSCMSAGVRTRTVALASGSALGEGASAAASTVSFPFQLPLMQWKLHCTVQPAAAAAAAAAAPLLLLLLLLLCVVCTARFNLFLNLGVYSFHQHTSISFGARA